MDREGWVMMAGGEVSAVSVPVVSSVDATESSSEGSLESGEEQETSSSLRREDAQLERHVVGLVRVMVVW